MTMSLEEQLCQHLAACRFEDLPADAVKAAKASILDTMGVMLASTTNSEDCVRMVELALDLGGRAESSIVGFGDRIPSPMAALINGALCHPLDYDDTHEGAKSHPTAQTLPAALAVAQRVGNVSGKDFITAVASGADFALRVALAVDAGPTEHGWLGSAVYGPFGAAAAAGKILRLSAGQMSDAIGMAYAQTGGTREMAEGSSLRGVRDGFSGKVGVMSALLADKGLTGPGRFLEGRAGVYNLYFRGKYTRERLTQDLGKVYEGANVSFKLWPSCRLTHTYIEAVITLMQEHSLGWEDVEQLEVIVSKWGRELCEPADRRLNPPTSVAAGDSMPFTLAVAMVHQNVKIEHFAQSALGDSRVLESARKVKHIFDEKLDPKDMTPADITMTIRDGRTLKKRVTHAYGSPQNPLKQGGLEEKFLDCATHSVKPITKARAEQLVDDMLNLEKLDSIEGIIP